VTLILNSEDLTIKGPGYSNISIPSQTLQGRESYIAIFCYPSSRVVGFDFIILYLYIEISEYIEI